MRRPSPQSERELLLRARALFGHSVAEVAAALDVSLPNDAKRAKGFVGTLLELALGADPDAGDGPDFRALGVELKSIPIDAEGRPAESTFVCSIHMAAADRESFDSSRLWRRLMCVLFMPVQAARLAPLSARTFGEAVLWRPSAGERELLRADFEDIMGAIGSGFDARLSAHKGEILQARPKAQNARARTLSPQSCGGEKVLPLGFYLRARFTRELLRGCG